MEYGGRARHPEELPIDTGSYLSKLEWFCDIVVKGCGIEVERIY